LIGNSTLKSNLFCSFLKTLSTHTLTSVHTHVEEPCSIGIRNIEEI
jgi:hypothetical protein